ncbi:hypothetical protein EDB89DRAFT_2074196 [Lactarius sanguifluus]|nr:hypothetical protein EDB89DRAFT_2074196 [Lactarius sanguifluus]
MAPAHIVAETRSEVERLSGGKVILLSRRWSQHAKAHNFVYTFKGIIPFETIFLLRDVLTKPLMTGHLVLNDRWTHAQLRNVITSNADGVIPDSITLEVELRHNPAFEEAIFCITPHWAGSLHNLATKPCGTVAFAYVDGKGHITVQAEDELLSSPPCSPPEHITPPAAPSAKGKAKVTAAHPVEDLVPSQREPPSTSADAADTNEGFTEVKRGKHQRNRGKAAVTAANANVLGASTASMSTTPPQGSTRRLTSKVPAQPLKKVWPTPPTKAEAPIIKEAHVASLLETSAALQRVLADNTGEPQMLYDLPFRYAVRYGFPLNREQTVRRIAGPDIVQGYANINEWTEEWGEITPYAYLITHTAAQLQTFEKPPPDTFQPSAANPVDAANNRTMALIVIEATIKTHAFLHHLDLEYITASTVEQMLDEYESNGAYDMFKLSNAEVIWDTLAETQALYDQIHNPL